MYVSSRSEIRLALDSARNTPRTRSLVSLLFTSCPSRLPAHPLSLVANAKETLSLSHQLKNEMDGPCPILELKGWGMLTSWDLTFPVSTPVRKSPRPVRYTLAPASRAFSQRDSEGLLEPIFLLVKMSLTGVVQAQTNVGFYIWVWFLSWSLRGRLLGNLLQVCHQDSPKSFPSSSAIP